MICSKKYGTTVKYYLHHSLVAVQIGAPHDNDCVIKIDSLYYNYDVQSIDTHWKWYDINNSKLVKLYKRRGVAQMDNGGCHVELSLGIRPIQWKIDGTKLNIITGNSSFLCFAIWFCIAFINGLHCSISIRSEETTQNGIFLCSLSRCLNSQPHSKALK